MQRLVIFSPDHISNANALETIARAPGVHIVEQTGARAFLVRASKKGTLWLRAHLTGWVIAPETSLPAPKLPHKSIRANDD